MTRRAFRTGTATILLTVVAYSVVCRVLPDDSNAKMLVSDLGMMLIEATSIALCWLAFSRAEAGRERWVWFSLSIFLAANLFGDAVWSYYDIVLRAEVPTPSLADVGYLVAYPLALCTVALGAMTGIGRMRMLEAGLDALMFTIGLAGISWPLLVGPTLDTAGAGMGFWVNLAYPVGDLIVILAMISLLFSARRYRLPRFLPIILASFVVQVVADSAYFGLLAAGSDYGYGGWLDSMWTLALALGGIAAMYGLHVGARAPAPAEAGARGVWTRELGMALRRHGRLLVPYLAFPMIAGMISLQVISDGWEWTLGLQVLAYLGLALVAIVLARQSLTLRQNRQLTDSLSALSGDLAKRVEELAGLSGRLETLNSHANHLNTLRTLREVVTEGVELACLAADARVGWLVLAESDGTEQVVAVSPEGEVGAALPAIVEGEQLQELPLEANGDIIGKIFIARRTTDASTPSLAGAIAAHIATAIENIRRYEEVVRQAQNDPLTNLLNHRSVHSCLEEECRRTDRCPGNLSLVMLDVDDFKMLNDTYGHPAGDQVLLQIGRTMRSVLRQTDHAGRVGGDEFMLVLPNTDREGALQMSERLRQMLVGTPFRTPGGALIPLRLSLGIATYPADADTPERLVEAADANLYISKQRGGNAVTGCDFPTELEDDADGLLGIAGRMLDAVGARDHYTRRHSEQVVVYSLALGEAIGLADDSIHTLRLAAMLHDVGKIGVPVRILRKPGALDAGESTIVRRHVDVGESIVREMPRLEAVLRAVRSHHERHDGDGYPEGIGGSDIPLLAKILAIADTFAAMTVDRPYRKGMTVRQAREELLRVAGTQLDPGLVHEFVRSCVARSGETGLSAHRAESAAV